MAEKQGERSLEKVKTSRLMGGRKGAGAAETFASDMTEAAGVQTMGKIAESTNQAEAASERKIEAAIKGYFEVLEIQSEKADTAEERERIRQKAEEAYKVALDHDDKKSERRFQWNWKIIVGVAAVIGTGAAGVVKLLRR